ncbi:MAG: hypothetical protein KBD23_03685 [Gammaproteobacteria bacterium]|nr:hypothetical protein [Gammaproteobacteria bacterium]
MPTEDPKKNTGDNLKDEKAKALLFAAKFINKKQKIKARIEKVYKREAKELSNDVRFFQEKLLPGEKKLGTSTTLEKSKRSKVNPELEQTPSTSERLLTFFRSKPEESPRPTADPLLEKGPASAKKKPNNKK